MSARSGRSALLAALALTLLASLPCAASAAIRAGFIEQVIADSLDSPVRIAFAPGDRVLVCEQAGRLRVIKAGRLLARPFVTVPTEAVEEEGLLGVAVDPAFARSRRVYVLYTALAPTRHNVIAWYTASGDTAVGEGTIVYEFDPHGAHQHVGGALRFGPDGFLYASSGECGDDSRVHSLASTAGKLVRIDRDGRIPRDNPFPTQTRRRHGAIWARGFRNAFAFDFVPGTKRVYVNDVGGSEYEEVNDVRAGDDLGWPFAEGPRVATGARAPRHAYTHAEGCAITGGASYPRMARARAAFPAEWQGGYFYSDYCANEVRWLPFEGPAKSRVFGPTRVPGPVDLAVAPDGALWYLARGNSVPTGGPGSAWGTLVRVLPVSGGR